MFGVGTSEGARPNASVLAFSAGQDPLALLSGRVTLLTVMFGPTALEGSHNYDAYCWLTGVFLTPKALPYEYGAIETVLATFCKPH
jgi:hypothetical protein